MTCITALFAGTGAASHPARGHSSLLLSLGGHTWIAVDYGCTAASTAARLGVEPWEVDLFVLTHSHYDHVCGVPFAAFARSYKGAGPVKVAAPPGVVEALKPLEGILSGGGPVELLRVPLPVRVAGGEIRALPAVHTVEAYSIVVEYAGLKVVVSGDTRPTPGFKAEAWEADLAVHEATYPSGWESRARERGHSTVAEALAQVRGARLSALYHLTQESEADALSRLGGAGGRVILPADGAVVKIC